VRRWAQTSLVDVPFCETAKNGGNLRISAYPNSVSASASDGHGILEKQCVANREDATMADDPESNLSRKQQRSAREFAPVAGACIKWVGELNASSSEDLQQLYKIIADLQSAASALLTLPPFGALAGVKVSEGTQDATPDLTEYNVLVKKLSLLPIGNYSLIFDPLDLSAPPVVSSLQDDLADIYLDLRTGMKLFESGLWREALWEWRLLFRMHWGRHAVAAQTALWAALQLEGHDI
jgi:hypothetical protein